MGGGALEITTPLIAFMALLFTAGAALAALFRLVSTSTGAIRTELMAEIAATRATIGTVRAELVGEIEKQAALASKSRHDMSNLMQLNMNRIEVDVERLKREAVRREDMNAIENRLTAMLTKMEGKVDLIAEKVGAFAVLEKQVHSIDTRLTSILEGRKPERTNREG